MFDICFVMKEKQILERESIAGRISEFLKAYPPFTFITDEQLSELANVTSIQYFDDGQGVFNFGDQLHHFLYVVRKGAIKIISKSNELIDQCAEGEIFGSRAFMTTETYQASAIASPEALIIALPIDKMRALIALNPKLTEYFFGDFCSGVALRKRKLSEINTQYQNFKTQSDYRYSFEKGTLSNFKAPITCSISATIKEAALQMRIHRVGSIVVVNEQLFPIGIVTDTDLRNKVVTGDININERIEAIMSTPVKTVSAGKSSEEYLIEMIALGAHHLCVTENGTNNEPLKGVITDHDLLVSRGNNASILMKELKRAATPQAIKETVLNFDQLVKKLALHDYPILDLARIVRSFNKLLLQQTIALTKAQLGLDLPEESFCWLALGSTARGEQIIRTDFDSAIVVDNNYESQLENIQKLADAVFVHLVDFGYHTDKADIQSNNPTWIKTLKSWENQFMKWIDVPDENALLHATIFFDLMPFYGNDSLAERLQRLIFKAYRGNHSYTAFLATNALQNPPPLGFFKNLLLEKSGEQKNNFDIKLRAMMPMTDAARLKALEHNTMFPSNTIERYKRLMEKDKLNAPKYEDCAAAYEIFIRMRAIEGLQQGNDGRYINPANLGSLEKQILKNAFAPISEIQHMIKPS